jgi:hypothetical protein
VDHAGDDVRDRPRRCDCARIAPDRLLRPPVQFGVGAAFQSAGVPQVGAIAGPEYLLTVSEHGDLDKLDEALAARQIAWTADLIRRLDTVPREQLRRGDPTLGAGGRSGAPGAGGIHYQPASCSARDRRT